MRVPQDKMHGLVALVMSLVLLITLALPAQAADSTTEATVTEATYETFYPFDGNANSSDGLANGTVSGTPVYKDGAVGQAIELNGTNNYVTLPSNHALYNYVYL